MNFDDLDAEMRVFETAHDHCVLPGMYVVARLDGRSFTKLTKDTLDLERPFDFGFNQMMVEVTRHLMTESGFKFLYGYTESDEISLWFDPRDTGFNHKLRKLNSVLAGEASAKATARVLLGSNARARVVFDCRISQLPTRQRVVDYFRWRLGDSERNALNAWVFWTLRDNGMDKTRAHEMMSGMDNPTKHNALFNRGINYNDIPAWQKRGVGLYWKSVEITGRDPRDGSTTTSWRRRLVEDRDLPFGMDYSRFIQGFMAKGLAEEIESFSDVLEDDD